MIEKLRGHLAAIYGEEHAGPLATEIAAPVEMSRTRLAATAIQLDPLGEQDTILITYAD